MCTRCRIIEMYLWSCERLKKESVLKEGGFSAGDWFRARDRDQEVKRPLPKEPMDPDPTKFQILITARLNRDAIEGWLACEMRK
jgi:hypothetical protein